MHPIVRALAVAALFQLAFDVAAQTITSGPTSTPTALPITAVSDCHADGTEQHCMYGSSTYHIVGPTKTEEMESQYTDCHIHGSETFCVNSHGEDVQLLVEGEEEHSEEEQEHEESGKNCHFHAGVEHCVGGADEEPTCELNVRHYNVPLRIGLLFVILVTSAIGVFSPILLTSFTRMSQRHIVFVMLKQFGTGVVISTAFVHLFTHAQLMFANECLGELEYEAATAAVFMAGLFLSFLVEYLGARFVLWRQNKATQSDTEDRSQPTVDAKSITPDSGEVRDTARSDDQETHGYVQSHADEQLGVMVLEAGVIFHSLLIGLTLVVAGDSFFLTLFAVIVFHQMFEGLALGTCIGALSSAHVTFAKKMLMAAVFAIITPLGMAIGIGVLNNFNGNDKSTIIAIGTLDALSAGILAWVGLVEMLAKDWMHGPLRISKLPRTVVAMVSLVAGLVLMSLLGKWA
ncbi:zinc/iron transporter protein [Amniculicola lignicola CBS 123094]|uniref:Zinc/iron transporter protein n=1 Tax=Amniculicola lignicola CBS 123094 TaxID=1392246 RepID=A0A6A5W3C7_9PLEO|nr:zinc/iron transporter protein [Amniculicola lignicola CBS 123094]